MGYYITDHEPAVKKSRQKADPPSKKRVWKNFSTTPPRAGFFASQPVEPHWEKQPTPTTTASGVLYYGYRFYSPELGRWISRDPIGERGGLNLYVMVRNNSLSLIDVRGDSPVDVDKIYSIYHLTVAEMTRVGDRHTNPTINNEMRSLYIVTLGKFGHPYLGCGEQADVVAHKLSMQVYDDTWTFTVERTWYLVHQVGKAKSSNPCDPIITFDPWKDEITEE